MEGQDLWGEPCDQVWGSPGHDQHWLPVAHSICLSIVSQGQSPLLLGEVVISRVEHMDEMEMNL